MKRILPIFILAIVAASFVFAQSGDSRTTQELMRIEQEWAAALTRNDAAALDRILAPDYVLTSAESETVPRAQMLADMRSGVMRFTAATAEDLQVRVYGQTAVVTGRGTFSGQLRGAPFSATERFTDVFVRRNGRWQAVSTHGSPMTSSASGGSNANVEQELIRLDQEWTQAELRGDRAAVARFLADDYTATNGANGQVINKTQALAELRAQPNVTDTADDYTVRVYGDTAVMTHRGMVRGQDNGQQVNEQYRSTHTWVRRNGRWQLVSHHSSPISAEQPTPSGGSNANVEQELIQLDRDWGAAGARGDMAALERIYAPDYTSTNAMGRTVTRAETLADARANAGRTNQDSISYDDYHVQVHGNAAVLTHRTTVRGMENGQPTTTLVRSMHVFVRRDGRWQAVYSQGTRIAPPQTP